MKILHKIKNICIYIKVKYRYLFNFKKAFSGNQKLPFGLISLCCSMPIFADLQFSEASFVTGTQHSHALVDGITSFDAAEGGGVAVGDYNQDGHIDLYIVTGDDDDNVLLKNNGDGTFSDQTSGSGLALSDVWNSGPVFADINGDGWVDLLVGSMQGEGFFVFLNDQDGTFTDVSMASNVIQQNNDQNDISTGLGDVDKDGDLDLFIGHHSWDVAPRRNHLWVNNGLGVFTAADGSAGTDAFGTLDLSFAPTFVDVNGDGWQDLLVTVDSNQSRVFLNDGDGSFTDDNGPNFNDQFGMGSAAADYDNDGDIDWFVTSIHDHPLGPQQGRTGNRLYINNGSGEFTDDSANAGVRQGYWGWGACAADFDNDGWLDIFHVNGMYNISGQGNEYLSDPSRLFLNNQDGTFTESSSDAGLVDTGQGRTEVCFDYDEDGDIDIFVFNVGQSTLLYRNDLTDNPGYLQVDVMPESLDKTLAGTVIEVVTGALTQTRHITVGSNFESQEPFRQHFGLGGAQIVNQVRVTRPSGEVIILNNVGINQILLVNPEQAVFTDGFES